MPQILPELTVYVARAKHESYGLLCKHRQYPPLLRKLIDVLTNDAVHALEAFLNLFHVVGGKQRFPVQPGHIAAQHNVFPARRDTHPIGVGVCPVHGVTGQDDLVGEPCRILHAYVAGP